MCVCVCVHVCVCVCERECVCTDESAFSLGISEGHHALCSPSHAIIPDAPPYPGYHMTGKRECEMRSTQGFSKAWAVQLGHRSLSSRSYQVTLSSIVL